MSTVTRECDVRDEVKHKEQEYAGVILAKYLGSSITNRPNIVATKNYVDVRIDENKVYYCSPAENWEITTPVEDIE